MMSVGDRHRQRIGRVRTGNVHTGKQPLDHGMDLRLLGTAGADNRFLDQPRGIFADVDSRAGGNHQRNAARLAELEGRLRVLVDEYFLDRGGLGRMVGEECFQLRSQV